MLQIDENLVLLDLIAPDAEAVIRALADRLYAHGAVSEAYGDATIERERNHPTGLPTKPFCIAFPHAGTEGVFHSSLAVASLRKSVTFKNMADPDEDLPVVLVFLLANNSPEEQVEALRNLALVFGQPQKLEGIRKLQSPLEVASFLKQELKEA